MSDDPFDIQHPLLDELDTEIVMHRNAHFGGSFDAMLEYYKRGGVGAVDDFTPGRIEKLKEMGPDIDAMLPEEAKIKVQKVKHMYQDLRSLYEKEGDPKKLLVTDMLLSEDPEPKKEMDAVVAEKETTYSSLIHMIDSLDFYDPLYPGYGRGPQLAAACLARIGNPEALPHLFNALSYDDFFASEAFLTAIASFGEKAKQFLLEVLGTTPYGKDNDMAASALSSMPIDERVSKKALDLMLNPNFQKHPTFMIYLVLLCSELKMDEDRQIFQNLRKKDFPKEVHEEMDLILKHFD